MGQKDEGCAADQVSDRIFTVPNIISFVRLCLVPVFLVLLLNGFNVAATLCGLFLVGRLPLWIILVVLVRDLLLLMGGAVLLKRFRVRVAVIFPGKVATTLLFVGFAGLLLNWPLVPGLGLVDAAWLPGLNGLPCSWGIWFVYAGLALGLVTTAYYIAAALRKLRAVKDAQAESTR